MATIRWRLVMGLVSLAATIILTFPAGASRQLDQVVGDIWPNGNPVADIWPNGDPVADIWPNGVVVDIWPNGALADIASSLSGTSQGN